MTKTAVILFAPGAEETELVITCDVLRRAGVDVTIAGVTLSDDPVIECVQKTRIAYDAKFSEIMNKEFDLVVIPGGPGRKEICACPKIGDFLRRHFNAGKFIGGICAGPLALQAHGISHGSSVTLYPQEKDSMVKDNNYKYTGDRLTVSGNIITSQAPGTAFEFATKLVELLLGPDKARNICESLLCTCQPVIQPQRVR